MREIYVKEKDVWKFFFSSYNRMREEIVIIAADSNTGFSVTITDEDMKPLVAVYQDGNLTASASPENSTECESVVTKFYQTYLPESKTLSIEDDEDVELDALLQSKIDEVYEREDELTMALIDFLDVALGKEASMLLEDEIEAMKEDILDLIADEYGYSIYRPAFISDESGTVSYFSLYPYN